MSNEGGTAAKPPGNVMIIGDSGGKDADETGEGKNLDTTRAKEERGDVIGIEMGNINIIQGEGTTDKDLEGIEKGDPKPTVAQDMGDESNNDDSEDNGTIVYKTDNDNKEVGDEEIAQSSGEDRESSGMLEGIIQGGGTTDKDLEGIENITGEQETTDKELEEIGKNGSKFTDEESNKDDGDDNDTTGNKTDQNNKEIGDEKEAQSSGEDPESSGMLEGQAPFQHEDDRNNNGDDNTAGDTPGEQVKNLNKTQKKKKQLRQAQERVRELEKTISQLKEENQRFQKLEGDNFRLQEEHGRLSEKLKWYQNENEKLQSNSKRLSGEVDTLKKAQQTIQTAFQNQKREQERSKADYDRKLKQQQTDAKHLQEQISDFKRTVYYLKQQLQSAEENNSILTQEKKGIYEEKQTLLLRLSKIAGAHLSHDNPNIADLNDQNRPTKLAEAFSELYDNEWTDAYEVFEDAGDTDGVKTLFNILQSCYSKVRETSTRHTEGIKGSLSVKVNLKERPNPLSSVLTEASGSVEERSNPLSSVETEASVSNEILDTDEHANGEPKKEEDCDEIAGNQNNKPSAPNNKDDDLSDVNEEDPAVHIEHRTECNDWTKFRNFIAKENGCIGIATTNEDQAKIQLVEDNDTSHTKGDVVVQKADTMINKHTADENNKLTDEQQPLKQKEIPCGTNAAVTDDTQEHILDTDKTTRSDDDTEAQALGFAKGNMPFEQQNMDPQEVSIPIVRNHDTEPTVVTQRQTNVSTEDVICTTTGTMTDCDALPKETWKLLPYDFDLLSVTQKQALLEIKKQAQLHVEDDVVKVIKESVLAELDLVDSHIVNEYVTKCCQICWDMYKHSPPVHVEFIDVQENTPMDTNVYKAYTIGGKFLDYVVWPPIYLHENGPMLAKGVAQGKGKK